MPMLRLFTRTALVLFMVLALITGGLVALLKMQPHGNWLTFTLEDTDTETLYLWDGRITQPLIISESFWDAAWSNSGWLAGSYRHHGVNDVFVWDGTSMWNISQNDDTAVTINFLRWLTNRRLLWTSIDGSFHVWEDGREMIFDSATEQYVNAYPDYSGGIAFNSSQPSDIFVWDGTDINQITNTPEVSECTGGWSRDDRLVFYSPCAGGDIYVWDGISITNISDSAAFDSRPRWSPDGRLAWIACEQPNCGGGTLMIWDGTTITMLNAAGFVPIDWLFWVRNGSLFWNSMEPDQAFVWDGAQILELPPSYVWNQYPPDVSANVLPEGATWFGQLSGVVMNYAWLNGRPVLLESGYYYVMRTALSPDGRFAWAGFDPFSIRIWEGGVVLTLMKAGEGAMVYAWSPIVP